MKNTISELGNFINYSSSKVFRNIIVLTTIILLFTTHVFSQTNFNTEVVYLKNGGVIRGIIIEQIPNEKLKIQTKDGNVFVFLYSEIEKITKEVDPSLSESYKKSKPNPTTIDGYKSSGYFNATEIVFGFGVGDVKPVKGNGYSNYQNENSTIGFRTSHGYQFNPHFALGMGIGLEIGDRSALPIFFDLRFPFSHRKVNPTFNLALGLIGVESYFVNPSFGLKIFLNTRTAMNFNVGVNSQFLQTSPYNGYYSYNSNYLYLYNNLYFALGFSF
jgi:hypothetical protein